MTRYAEVTDVEGAFRSFSTPEKNRATYLLHAVGGRLSELMKDMDPTPMDAAMAVSIDLVVHAMAIPMDLVHHVAYSRTVGPRTKSGTLDPKRVGKLEWQDWHYDVLGIDRPGGPSWYFGDGPAVDHSRPNAGYGVPSAW